MATAKTVPVSWLMVGDEVVDRSAVTQAGGPADRVSGVTSAQDVPFHHCRVAPPSRLQSVTVRLLKLLPAATSTSKDGPAALGGVPAGSALYCDTVSDPSPVAVAMVGPLVTGQLVDDVADVQFPELVAPLGGAAGAGAVGVTDDEAPDGVPAPTELAAVTVKVYAVPPVRPVMVVLSELLDTVSPPHEAQLGPGVTV